MKRLTEGPSSFVFRHSSQQYKFRAKERVCQVMTKGEIDKTTYISYNGPLREARKGGMNITNTYESIELEVTHAFF